jgi:hypothetical protein
MDPNHQTGSAIRTTNGFAYDYCKLLLVRSPRRLFAARVRDTKQRTRLLRTLDALTAKAASDPGLLRRADQIAICIMLSGSRKRAESVVGVWRGGRFDTRGDLLGDTAVSLTGTTSVRRSHAR